MRYDKQIWMQQAQQHGREPPGAGDDQVDHPQEKEQAVRGLGQAAQGVVAQLRQAAHSGGGNPRRCAMALPSDTKSALSSSRAARGKSCWSSRSMWLE